MFVLPKFSGTIICVLYSSCHVTLYQSLISILDKKKLEVGGLDLSICDRGRGYRGGDIRSSPAFEVFNFFSTFLFSLFLFLKLLRK